MDLFDRLKKKQYNSKENTVMVTVRKYDASKDVGILEFQKDRTIVHIGSIATTSLFPKEDFSRKFLQMDYIWRLGGSSRGVMLIAVGQEESLSFTVIYGIKVGVPWHRKIIGFQLMQQADVFTREAV